MARVLFVDDEPHMLAGLRRTLLTQHRVRGGTGDPATPDLEYAFAGSGTEALEAMAAEPADVIVSDMRMPGMDGATLLGHVQRRWPACLRIVLSGDADRASVLSAVSTAQQFLAKPCDAATLLRVIDRALDVRSTLTAPGLRELIGGTGTLPTLPDVYDRLVAAIDSPDVPLADVARILAQDVATSADVLRLVNSAFFGMPQEVSRVQTAVALLGADNIQALVLAGSVFQVDDDLATVLGGELAGPRLRDHGLRRAALSRRLARAEGWDEKVVDQVGLAGMLHDVGLLVLARGRRAETATLVASLAVDPEAALDPVRRCALEAEAFGCTVPQAGAYLLGLWGFAPAVVFSLAAQPKPTTPRDQVVDFAHRRTLAPTRRVAVDDVPPLDATQVERWNRVCDEFLGAGETLDEAAS
ncbi:HDOD domain-containing protein [Spongisporangium articulatum]|uniref:HDOD domain-containing protein n=1 Tax=Spongisporangium articulatum TaxID=3362603 RepID=A0ABW8AJU3_9ACTN